MRWMLALAVSIASLAASAKTTPPASAKKPYSKAIACFDRCAKKRPAPADRQKLRDCMQTHVRTAAPKVAAIKRMARDARDAAWKAIHEERRAASDRCAPASLTAWNACLAQCKR